MRLFSVGVRMRTKSPLRLGVGEGFRMPRAARALTRGAHSEEREQRDDYSKVRVCVKGEVEAKVS